jgi:hypothetical protein
MLHIRSVSQSRLLVGLGRITLLDDSSLLQYQPLAESAPGSTNSTSPILGHVYDIVALTTRQRLDAAEAAFMDIHQQ